MIITGAPVEHLSFEEVDYWEELKAIMEWTKDNVMSTLHICWGAQAALYYHYGIEKYLLNEKMFGIFSHRITKNNVRLTRGFDENFNVPHSRHAETRREDVEKLMSWRYWLNLKKQVFIWLLQRMDAGYLLQVILSTML